MQKWVYKVSELHTIQSVHCTRMIHGTGCVRRPVMNGLLTFDHQLMLGYHFPLGYFATRDWL